MNVILLVFTVALSLLTFVVAACRESLKQYELESGDALYSRYTGKALGLASAVVALGCFIIAFLETQTSGWAYAGYALVGIFGTSMVIWLKYWREVLAECKKQRTLRQSSNQPAPYQSP